ncbi:protein of unknown function [Alteromonas macleodii]|uniref:Uncharacterized protein n=1 Tax=Alteromonas macleodii TaxID=28108 RepID=A0A6T9Y1H3_ALTMA|nr:protein of unknown function [Alteromonas macleodii]
MRTNATANFDAILPVKCVACCSYEAYITGKYMFIFMGNEILNKPSRSCSWASREARITKTVNKPQ